MDDKTAAEHGAWQAILHDTHLKLKDGTFQHDFSRDYEQWVTVKAEYRDGSGDAGSLQMKILSIHWALQALIAKDEARQAEVLRELDRVPETFLAAFLLAIFQVVVQYDARNLPYPAQAVFREQVKARILDVLGEGSEAIRQLAAGFRASLTKPLLELFADPLFELRSELPQLIGILRDPSGFKTLVEVIENGEHSLETVVNSVHVLADNFPCSETKPVLLRVVADHRRSASIVANATAALAKNCADPEVVSAIAGQLTNSDSDIRRIAASELYRLDHPDILEILLQQLRDPDPGVAEQAQRLLTEGDSRDILPALKKMASWLSREKRPVKERAKSIIRHLEKGPEEQRATVESIATETDFPPDGTEVDSGAEGLDEELRDVARKLGMARFRHLFRVVETVDGKSTVKVDIWPDMPEWEKRAFLETLREMVESYKTLQHAQIAALGTIREALAPPP